jgi:hypothetical protein
MTEESPVFEPTRRQWTGYWSMIVQQTQNAFNDKMAQFILIPLAGALAFRMPLPGGAELGVESAAGLMITLPFVLLAPIAAAVLWMGVYPESFMKPMRADVGRLLERIERATPESDAHLTAGKPQAAPAHGAEPAHEGAEAH